MIDIESIKSGPYLVQMVEQLSDLKIKSRATGEMAGECPFCGGKDRFVVKPRNNPPVWLCRHCSPKWDTVLGFVARQNNLDLHQQKDLQEACRIITGAELPKITRAPQIRYETPAYSPPDAALQKDAAAIVGICQENLQKRQHEIVRRYLTEKRGLLPGTIENFSLGFSEGFRYGNRWVPRGILIPCSVGGVYWYLKLRLPVVKGGTKYLCVAGSRPAAIFNGDALRGQDNALFCEGEFDCMVATQEIGDVISTVTFGSATNRPDLATWGLHLLALRLILAAYDNDESGQSGSEALAEVAGEKVKLAPLPEGVKDINDLHLKNGAGALWRWIEPYLQFYDPLYIADPGSSLVEQVERGGLLA